MRRATLLLLASLVLALWGCDAPEEGRPERKQRGPLEISRAAYDPGELAGSAWTLRELYGERVVEGSRITLRFEPEAMSGYTGCNALRGTQLQAAGGAFMTPGPEISLVPCTGELGRQQGRYLTALAEAATYRRAGGRLEISDTLGQRTLVFVRSGG